jgi:hypothetical protein
MPLESAWLES